MRGIKSVVLIILALSITACAKTNSGGTESGKGSTNKTVSVQRVPKGDPITGYKGINWGESRAKVEAVYGKDPNYSMEWNVLGRIPFLDLRTLDAQSPVEKIKIYFYKDQVQQISILYRYKESHSKTFFDALTKKYNDYGGKYTEKRTGPIDNSYQGTKFTRKWVDGSTIVNLDYFKDFQKGTFVWIGNFTLLSVRIIDQEIEDNKKAAQQAD